LSSGPRRLSAPSEQHEDRDLYCAAHGP
jgi:hypothetical protein